MSGADDEAVREAEAWFREHTRGGVDSRTLIESSVAGERYAATIVRAWLARDVPAPAGRDLTAQDVRDTLAGWEFVGDVDRQYAADHLTEIARPSGGVGQPDTAEPRIPTAAEIVDEYEASQLDDRWDTRTETWEPQAAEPCAADGPRDALGIVRCVRTAGHDGDHQAHDSWNLVTWGNEPPAPEPVTVLAGEFCPLDGCTAEGRMHTHERADYDRAVQQAHEPAPEPQVAGPPRFERGFYRLARDLDVGPDTVTAGSLIFLASVEHNGTHGAVHGTSALARVSLAALAAAGAERVEER